MNKIIKDKIADFKYLFVYLNKFQEHIDNFLDDTEKDKLNLLSDNIDNIFVNIKDLNEKQLLLFYKNLGDLDIIHKEMKKIYDNNYLFRKLSTRSSRTLLDNYTENNSRLDKQFCKILNINDQEKLAAINELNKNNPNQSDIYKLFVEYPYIHNILVKLNLSDETIEKMKVYVLSYEKPNNINSDFSNTVSINKTININSLYYKDLSKPIYEFVDNYDENKTDIDNIKNQYGDNIIIVSDYIENTDPKVEFITKSLFDQDYVIQNRLVVFPNNGINDNMIKKYSIININDSINSQIDPDYISRDINWDPNLINTQFSTFVIIEKKFNTYRLLYKVFEKYNDTVEDNTELSNVYGNAELPINYNWNIVEDYKIPIGLIYNNSEQLTDLYNTKCENIILNMINDDKIKEYNRRSDEIDNDRRSDIFYDKFVIRLENGLVELVDTYKNKDELLNKMEEDIYQLLINVLGYNNMSAEQNLSFIYQIKNVAKKFINFLKKFVDDYKKKPNGQDLINQLFNKISIRELLKDYNIDKKNMLIYF